VDGPTVIQVCRGSRPAVLTHQLLSKVTLFIEVDKILVQIAYVAALLRLYLLRLE
jgi:hypothetical protein